MQPQRNTKRESQQSCRQCDVLNVARAYLSRGWRVIPVPFRTKKPILDGWPDLRLTQAELPEHFSRPTNLGVLLGEPSRWLVDVDHPLAVELADEYIPATGSVFGRAGKPRSHRLFVVTSPLKTHQRRIPKPHDQAGEMIVEIRSTSAQSVFPSSIHETGEPIEWAADGEPAVVAPGLLVAAFNALADEVERRLGIESKPAAKPIRASRNGGAGPLDRDKMKRCRAYVDKMPPAISGQGGHDRTLHVACELFRFGLSDGDAVAVLAEYNQRCRPPWTDKELAHKLEDARAKVEADGEFGCRLAEDGPQAVKSLPAQQKGEGAFLPPLASEQGRTDAANMDRLLAHFGGNVRYVPVWDKWLVWDGKRWKLDDAKVVHRHAMEWAKGLFAQLGDEAADVDKSTLAKMQTFCKRSNDAGRMDATLKMLGPYVAVTPAELDADPMLLNVANGTVDLRTGNLRPHDSADLLTKLSPARYDSDTGCPEWLAFLRDVFDGDEEIVRFVQRLAGYSLNGTVREHVLAFLHGVGSNGKSTLVETLLGVWGDYGMKANAEMLLARKHEAHPTERADLHGKRLIVAVEADAGQRFAESLLKELTGGDRIRARRMRENFWEFVPSHTIWLAANHKPVVRGTDDGFWRRIKLVPFERQWDTDGDRPDLPAADKHLGERLAAERDGILTWCLMGHTQWQGEGLQTPQQVLAATREYRAESDLIGQFIDELCVTEPGRQCRASDLYAAYVKWCEDGRIKAMSQTAFGREMTQRGYGVQKVGGVCYRCGVTPVGRSQDA